MPGVRNRTVLALLVFALAITTASFVAAASRPATTRAADSGAPPRIAASSALRPTQTTSVARRTPLAAEAPIASNERAVESHSVWGTVPGGLFTPGAVPPLIGLPRTPPVKRADPGGPSYPEAPRPSCDRWLAEEARDTVKDNEPELEQLADAIAADLLESDLAELNAGYAPGESVTTPLGSDWPPLETIEGLPTVNIFLAHDSLVYFTYALAEWTDAGVTSQRTVCIPMRFVDGAWYLTTIDDSTDGLVFVTSVRL